MYYPFPKIEHIDHVLHAIKGYDEFVVAKRPFGTVINYVVTTPNTFGPVSIGSKGAPVEFHYGSDDLIRRELRGIIFGNDGKIISRPFHKFFNLGEREETMAFCIDLGKPHAVYEKMDGSMVRPLFIDGKVTLATKMGVTDVAEEANKHLTLEQSVWLADMYRKGKTPLLEYVSPTNRIVVEYSKPDLVLLAIRDNVTGEYESFPLDSPFTPVPCYGSLGVSVKEYIANASEQTEREGDVIRFNDGHMVKVKNSWYARLHKMKELVQSNRHVINLMINNELDDIISQLPEDDAANIRKYEETFWARFGIKKVDLMAQYENAKNRSTDRKSFAGEVSSVYVDVPSHMLFKMYDGKTAEEVMLDYVKANITSNTKCEALEKFLKISG